MAVDLAQATAPARLAQDTASLRHAFSSVIAESCPYAFNFHIHTVYSDGKLQPTQVVEQAIALGLKGLAITDHHTVNGYLAAQAYLDQRQQAHGADQNQTPAPHLWVGVEINANLLDTEVHILCYAFDPSHARMQPYLRRATVTGTHYQAQHVIAAAHAAGGIAVLAHPARYRLPAADLIPEAARLSIDGIETYYAYNNPDPWAPSPSQTEDVYQLGMSHQLLHTCGTDTHGLSLLKRL